MATTSGIITFLINNDQILLAESNYRPGKTTWNGISGLMKGQETPVAATVRELYGGIKVRVYEHDLEHAGIIHLYTLNQDGTRTETLTLTLFICEKWQGEPRGTPGIRPRWFGFDVIPYDDMFEDTKEWLPKILAGEKVLVEILSQTNPETGKTFVQDVLVHSL